MGEWLKPTDCKSVAYGYVGSNPALSTKSYLYTPVFNHNGKQENLMVRFLILALIISLCGCMKRERTSFNTVNSEQSAASSDASVTLVAPAEGGAK